MIESFINRENEIFNILQKFLDADLDFIIIGGYAVSAYQHRFSVDADVVIQEKDRQKFVEVLTANKFRQTTTKKIVHSYAIFSRFEKSIEKLSVSIDLLINGVAMRQTGGFISYVTLKKHAVKKTIKGMQKEVTVWVASREALIAMKLHAGRLTDLRDIASLAKNLNNDVIQELIITGDTTIVKVHIKKLIDALQRRDFIDSFKGVFQEKKYTIHEEEIKKLAQLKL